MSSPFNEPLPPPPSAAISSATPGNEPHTKWDPIYIHTAKCDMCHEHNTSVIQRCPRCNRQLCRKCIPTAGLDGIHSADINELDWNVYTRLTAPKKTKAGKSVEKQRATSSSSRASTRSGVCKNTASKKGSRAPSEGLFMDSDSTVEDVRAQSVADQQSSALNSSKKGKDSADSVQSIAESSGDHYSTTPGLPPPSKYQPPRTKIRFRTPLNGSSSRSGSSPFAATSGSSIPSGHVPSRLIGVKQAMNPAANAVMESLTGNRAASVEQSLPVEQQSPCMRQAAHAEEDTEIKGETFDDAISRVKEERDAKRLRDEEQSKRDAFEVERISAWESNPDVCALRKEGRIDEANELMEAAAILIRAQRGL